MRLLPFSKILVDLFDELVNFIDEYYLFMEGIPQQNNELDDFAKKTIENFVGDVICGGIGMQIAGCKNITKIIQISENSICLYGLIEEIERKLAEKRGVSQVHLQSRSDVSKTKKEVEFKLFELVNSKMDEFLLLNDYKRFYFFLKKKSFKAFYFSQSFPGRCDKFPFFASSNRF